MNYSHKDTNYSIVRYPKSDNKSLKAWSAADEHLLKHLSENNAFSQQPILYNDRFGFLSTVLSDLQPFTVINFKSQEKALEINATKHGIDLKQISKIKPLDELSASFDLALIKIPKSLDLFRLQLDQVHQALNEDATVICSFMTKYFSRKTIDIAENYFEQCEQSRAWKKSRLLILKKKKKVAKKQQLNTISLDKTKSFKQYYGVFSGKNIDYATQFFAEHLEVKATDNKILDLASGNGVLAHVALSQNPNAEIHLVDDSLLAVESSKINIDSKNAHFHFSDNLSAFDNNTFDLVISNPPFHFGFETNIEIALSLFEDVKRCLKKGGVFQLVTSNHLNLKTHLFKLFHKVKIVAQNDKFVVYHCQ
ncbi:MAG: methyltransferase [Flavobacteriales bacterium]|nr:methyltransferase [Flavobacteriales bacterium]